MHVVHVLRKYNPSEWGGTETAIRQLCDGLRHHGLGSVVYCPQLEAEGTDQARGADPLVDAGCVVKRFKTCVPVWGIPPERRRQMVSVGGNLMSFDLLGSLWRDPAIAVVHSHALGRLGGIGLTVARRRKLPFVVTIHGGVYDLPATLLRDFANPEGNGLEWGKVFGLMLRARRVLLDADAIVTCNPREAELIRKKHPDRRVLVQPHGVPAGVYQKDGRAAAREAFPWITGRTVLLSVGRIDPVKNQMWLVEQMPALLQRHPRALLVLAGPCTDEPYGEALTRKIDQLGLADSVRLTGKIPPGDPRLIGLMQESKAVLLPSISETFGLVILEAWAAGTAVISSGTSGAHQLIEHEGNGWLFALERPEEFHAAIDQVLGNPDWRARSIAAGNKRVVTEYDSTVLSARMKQLYETLIEEKNEIRYSA